MDPFLAPALGKWSSVHPERSQGGWCSHFRSPDGETKGLQWLSRGGPASSGQSQELNPRPTPSADCLKDEAALHVPLRGRAATLESAVSEELVTPNAQGMSLERARVGPGSCPGARVSPTPLPPACGGGPASSPPGGADLPPLPAHLYCQDPANQAPYSAAQKEPQPLTGGVKRSPVVTLLGISWLW